MAVGVYLRVSTEEQRDRQSIDTQREFAIKYCELHKLTIYDIYADDGLSGTLPLECRPAAMRLFEGARQRRFDQVLIYKLDRLGRDARLILNSVAALEKFGVRVRSGTEEFDTATATGRLMLTMLSGFAAHERELIRERSVAGTNRLAKEGAWLGGIVPYGYRKQGEKREAKLAITEEPIPGFNLSEAEVVGMIFRMSGVERKSCQKIADHLNRTGIPCGSQPASTEQGGKRNRRTAAIWRPSHVRNMLVNQTYMGKHVFGKRSKSRNRDLIDRIVPAIVAEQTFQAAQAVLNANRIICRRTSRQPFLLRGLIKCGLCGLTFSGMRMSGQKEHYYRCNGRQFARGLYGLSGKKCPGKSLNGDYVERLVWADIESFLRNPGELLERLKERLCMQDGERQRRQKELDDLKERLQQKAVEAERVLTQFRRGRISEALLDRQLDSIKAESNSVQAEIETASRTLSADPGAQLQSAEALLQTLRSRLDGTVPPELKRKIIEILVERIQANTVERWGVQQSEVHISYRFSQPDEPAPLVLPRSHRMDNRYRPPEQLNTVGDHLRRRRLTLKLLQRQVAEQLGVSKESIYNWETNQSAPNFREMPAIIRFLGYNPTPTPERLADRLIHGRMSLGLSQKEAAREMNVDPSTLARWERGERKPKGTHAAPVSTFLATAEAACVRTEAQTA